MREEIYALWFNNIKGVGHKNKAILLSNIGSYEDIFKAGEKVYKELVGIKITNAITNNKDLERIYRLEQHLLSENVKFTYIGHDEYPTKLINIYDFPFLLYYKGKSINHNMEHSNSIAMVGSRKASFYGKEVAYSFGKRLAQHNISVISGLAYGIDYSSHRGALDQGGYTIGVLGCGINVVYPRSSVDIYNEMCEKGTIVSEYGLDVQPNIGLFPQRNRIISGLSDGVFVVEAEKKSGSLITADSALEQGKTVMALPGRISDTKSYGCNNLIKMGAYCITCFDDLLDILGVIKVSPKENNGNQVEVNKCEQKENSLAPLEKMVYSCVSLEPIYIDDILYKTNIKATELINILFGLENKGIIKQPLKGYYIINM